MMNIQEARQLVKETLSKFGIIKEVSVNWASSFTRKAGVAELNLRTQEASIRLSSKLFALATIEQQRETIIHEACHIVVFLTKPWTIETEGPHGISWQSCMRSCGYSNPERCHNIKRTEDMRSPNRRVTAYCGCGSVNITLNRYTRMQKGASYICLRCNRNLSLRPEKV